MDGGRAPNGIGHLVILLAIRPNVNTTNSMPCLIQTYSDHAGIV